MSLHLSLSDAMLLAFLDEALPADQMAEVERRLRDDLSLSQRLVAILGQRDAGVHSVGDIWRRHRLSCLSRQQLGSYLLGAVMEEDRNYIEFHLQKIGCRICLSNLEDLQRSHQESPSQAVVRRQKYFQSSAGYLRRDRD